MSEQNEVVIRKVHDGYLVELLDCPLAYTFSSQDEAERFIGPVWQRLDYVKDLHSQALRAENARLRRGLENCHMLARRIVASESAFFKIDSANHIIRMCEEAGVTSMKGVLKDAALREHIKQLESNAVNLVDRNKALRIECVEAQQERDALRLKV